MIFHLFGLPLRRNLLQESKSCEYLHQIRVFLSNLGEFDKRSNHCFPVGDHFINSSNLFSLLCITRLNLSVPNQFFWYAYFFHPSRAKNFLPCKWGLRQIFDILAINSHTNPYKLASRRLLSFWVPCVYAGLGKLLDPGNQDWANASTLFI